MYRLLMIGLLAWLARSIPNTVGLHSPTAKLSNNGWPSKESVALEASPGGKECEVDWWFCYRSKAERPVAVRRHTLTNTG